MDEAYPKKTINPQKSPIIRCSLAKNDLQNNTSLSQDLPESIFKILRPGWFWDYKIANSILKKPKSSNKKIFSRHW